MVKSKMNGGLVLVVLLLICGCSNSPSNTKDPALEGISKSTLKNDFAMGIESLDCDKAKAALKKMKKLDPKDEKPLKYYVDETYTETVSMKYDELDKVVDTCINGDVSDDLRLKMAMASQAALDESLDELKNSAQEGGE